VLGSIGTVGDCYDNALAESFVDSYKTELIADRVWRSRSELELASVEWVAWFNTVRLHSSLGDSPPVEFRSAQPGRTADHRRARFAFRQPYRSRATPKAAQTGFPPAAERSTPPPSSTTRGTTPPGSSPIYGSETY